MNACAVSMRLSRRKSNTFGKLCSQKQQQPGREMGRSFGEPVRTVAVFMCAGMLERGNVGHCLAVQKPALCVAGRHSKDLK